jgi:stage II sporulation protein M
MKKRARSKIYRSFLSSLRYISTSKRYIYFSLALFIAASIIGFLFPGWFEEQILKLIEELIKKTEDMGTFELIRFIMLNNIRSSFIALITGVFLGIIPLIITITNGYVIGFVANKTISIGGITVLWRLLPHGVFEIPAVIISIGIGFRLGMFFIVSKKRNLRELWKELVSALKVFLLVIIPLLIIAGIIEGVLIKLLG